MELKAVRGMHDLFGAEIEKWRYVERKIHDVFATFGYQEIRTPVLEKIEVFKHAVGDQTDIVEKQMYTVEDRGGRPDATPETLVLRPEGTAGFVRAVVEHQLHQSGLPQRYYYFMPMFRYERPQKGRLRQFHQFGAELINDPSPEADAELLLLLDHIYRAFGLTEYENRLNSVGCNECRPVYKERLKDYFRPHLASLCEQCQKRFERAPMRILDCKSETCRALAEKAPVILDNLCANCASHHATVKRRLTAAGVPFVEDPHIVRGLDYYLRTAFEFTSPLLGAQSALGGGGRYDGLSAKFGKASFPAIGWALGMERLMLALETKQALPDTMPRPDVFLAPIGEPAFEKLYPLSLTLKRRGIRAEMSYDKTKGLKWLMKQADRVGARFTVLVGDTELQNSVAIVKNMTDGTQDTLALADIDRELERRTKGAH